MTASPDVSIMFNQSSHIYDMVYNRIDLVAVLPTPLWGRWGTVWLWSNLVEQPKRTVVIFESSRSTVVHQVSTR